MSLFDDSLASAADQLDPPGRVLDEMFETMALAHRGIAIANGKAALAAMNDLPPDQGTLLPPPPGLTSDVRLAYMAIVTSSLHQRSAANPGHRTFSVSLPAECSAVYLQDPEARFVVGCGECGLVIPAKRSAVGELVPCLPHCPACEARFEPGPGRS